MGKDIVLEVLEDTQYRVIPTGRGLALEEVGFPAGAYEAGGIFDIYLYALPGAGFGRGVDITYRDSHGGSAERHFPIKKNQHGAWSKIELELDMFGSSVVVPVTIKILPSTRQSDDGLGKTNAELVQHAKNHPGGTVVPGSTDGEVELPHEEVPAMHFPQTQTRMPEGLAEGLRGENRPEPSDAGCDDFRG